MTEGFPYAFQMGGNDIISTIVDVLKLKWTAASPFAAALGNYVPGTDKITRDMQEIALDAYCRKALTILAMPSAAMIFNTGGGMTDISHMNAYSNKAVAGEAVVTITPSFNESIMVQYFDTPESFGQWFADAVSIVETEELTDWLPPKISLDSLIYVLHAIDGYRRITYRNMLEYKTEPETAILAQELAQTLGTAIKSKDIRWLLPAFAVLTPGLARYDFKISQESMGILLGTEILLPVLKAGSKEQFYKYTEKGRHLSAGFIIGWVVAAGFESVTYDLNGNPFYRNIGFLAPTATGNHLFLIDRDADGKSIVNCNNLSFAGLAKIMAGLMSMTAASAKASAPGAAYRPAPPPGATAGPPPGAAYRPAPPPGAAAGPPPGAAYRPAPPPGAAAGPPPGPARGQSQGRRQQGAPQCRTCGMELAPNVRFCKNCGTRIK